jgi:hypothetical protein
MSRRVSATRARLDRDVDFNYSVSEHVHAGTSATAPTTRNNIAMLNRRLMLAAVAAAFAWVVGPRLLVWAYRSAAPQKLAPYVQTPQAVVERMLQPV